VVATRGDRLALFGLDFESDGFELRMLVVSELNEQGQLWRAWTISDDDLDGATELLDERHQAKLGHDDGKVHPTDHAPA
jgi:hypothetical protein